MYDALQKVKPEPGLETAKPGPPTWCAETKISGTNWRPQLQITIRGDTTLDRLLDSARFACKWPNDPQIQKAVGFIMQWYINYTGLSLARATETFKTRISNKVIEGDISNDRYRFNEQQTQLCASLTAPKEMGGGEEIEFMAARRSLFGCGSHVISAPLWISDSNDVKDSLIPFLDSSSVEVDEAVRLAWLLTRTRYISTEGRPDLDVLLATYVTDQVDFDLLSEAKVMKLLDTPPYKGNGFARTILLESFANVQLGIRLIRAQVAKRATDAGWKELLTTAPQRGIAEWTKLSAQYKDVLARSAAFEAKFFGPSRKALKGCWPDLLKDFVEVTKTLKRGSAVEFQNSLSEPVPALLFSRLVACASIDADPSYTGVLRLIEKQLRYGRGARTAAFYSAVDALQEIVADRDQFPVSLDRLRIANNWVNQKRLFEEAVLKASVGTSKYPNLNIDQEKGTVKSVKKVGDNIQVTFVTTKVTYMGTHCTDTNKIVQWDGNGSPIYWRTCKETGMRTYDSSPDDVLIPSAWADGVKAGVVMEFDVSPFAMPNRFGVPREVYTDKTRKKLINFSGIGL